MLKKHLIISTLAISLISLSVNARISSIEYPIRDVWQEDAYGLVYTDHGDKLFDVTCKSVEGLDTVTVFKADGKVDKSYSLSESEKLSIINAVCPKVEQYANQVKFIEGIGYLNDYQSKSDKKMVCSLDRKGFNQRELKLIKGFCK